MQIGNFADELARDVVFDKELEDVLRPDRTGHWLSEATVQAGKMPADFYIHHVACRFFSQMGVQELLLLLFCVEVEAPYRDYLPFADQVEWLFTEDDETLGKRMAMHHKVKSSLRAYVANKFCFF